MVTGGVLDPSPSNFGRTVPVLLPISVRCDGAEVDDLRRHPPEKARFGVIRAHIKLQNPLSVDRPVHSSKLKPPENRRKTAEFGVDFVSSLTILEEVLSDLRS